MAEFQTLTDFELKVLRVANNEKGYEVSCGPELDKALKKLKHFGFIASGLYYCTYEGKQFLENL